MDLFIVGYWYTANYVPCNSYVDALTPNVTVHGDRVFKEVIKVRKGHRARGLIQ